jgi:ribonuclease P protein component
MLNKKYRLKKDFQFRYIYRNGQSIRTNAISLIFVKSKQTGIKIGISVSNKIGKAFFRNRIKRLIRENVRAQLDNMIKGYNYIFVANNNFDFSNSDYSLISNYVTHAIKQANSIITSIKT